MARVTLRLPDRLHRRLRAACRREGVSLNQLITHRLNEALGGAEEVHRVESPLMEQVQHIRTALGDLAVSLEMHRFPPHLRPGDDLPDREAFMRSLPELDPPLSATIIAEREDRF